MTLVYVDGLLMSEGTAESLLGAGVVFARRQAEETGKRGGQYYLSVSGNKIYPGEHVAALYERAAHPDVTTQHIHDAVDRLVGLGKKDVLDTANKIGLAVPKGMSRAKMIEQIRARLLARHGSMLRSKLLDRDDPTTKRPDGTAMHPAEEAEHLYRKVHPTAIDPKVVENLRHKLLGGSRADVEDAAGRVGIPNTRGFSRKQLSQRIAQRLNDRRGIYLRSEV